MPINCSSLNEWFRRKKCIPETEDSAVGTLVLVVYERFNALKATSISTLALVENTKTNET